MTFFKEEIEKYQYFRLSQWLFQPPYNELSSNAKLMYALLFDRMSLSLENEWHDTEGKVFMYFTNSEFCQALNCSEKTVTKIKRELADKGLLLEKRQGLSKPNRIYLLGPKLPDSSGQEQEKLPSRTVKNTATEREKVQTIKTNIIKTNLSKSNNQEVVRSVLAYLNEKTGKNFQARSSSHQKFIKARFNEGYSLEDFKKVIDVKVAEWQGTKWEDYLRPQTLFGNKFDTYLNQAPREEDKTPDERLGF